MSENTPQHSSLIAAIFATIVAFCWGGNFTAGKFALQYFPAVEASIIRFSLVCTLLLPLALRAPRMYWRDALSLSLLYVVLHFTLMFHAMESGLSVSSIVIVSQMGVPFSCILAAIFFKDYLGPWRSLGLLIAFIGLLLVAGTPNITDSWPPFLMAVLGAFSWGCANNYMKIMRKAGVVSMLFWPSLFAIPQLIIISLFTEKDYLTIINTAPLNAWLGIAYNALISSLLGYGLWMWLLQRHPISKVVPYSLTLPIFGLIIAQFFFPEPLYIEHYVGISLTVIGVGIITIRRPKIATAERI